MNSIGKIAQVLKHLHGRCVIDAFDKSLHEGSIWTVPRAVLSFILYKSIFTHFAHYRTIFYDKYITSDNKNKYIDDDGSHVFPKQKVRKLLNTKYQKIYSNRYYVLKSDFIKYIIICQNYSRRKRMATGFVYLKVSS